SFAAGGRDARQVDCRDRAEARLVLCLAAWPWGDEEAAEGRRTAAVAGPRRTRFHAAARRAEANPLHRSNGDLHAPGAARHSDPPDRRRSHRGNQPVAGVFEQMSESDLSASPAMTSTTESELEDRLSEPTPEAIKAIAALDGDVLLLGVAG